MKQLFQSRRTTILGGLLVGCLVMAGVGETLWTCIAAPLEARQAKLRALQQTVEQQETQVLAIRAAEVTQRTWQSCTLPADASSATTRYQHWLAAQLRDLQLERAVLTPGSASARSDHFWLPVQIETEASPARFAELLARLEQSPVLQRVQRIQVQAAGVGNREQLRVSLQVEALALTGPLAASTTSEHDPFAQVATTYEPSPLGAALSERNPFAIAETNVNVVATESVPALDSSIAVESAPTVETVAPPELRLVAVLVQSDKKLAWLYDSTTHQQQMLQEQQRLTLPEGEFEVLAIQPLYVELRAQGQRFQLALGAALAMPTTVVESTASNDLLATPAP